MGLFSKRPLCFFCTLFLLSSLAAFFISFKAVIIILIIFGVLASLACVLSVIVRKLHVKLVTVCVCLFVIFAAFLHSFIFVGLPTQRAEKYVGERRVSCYIIDSDEYSESTEKYYVRIKNIDGTETNIRANLFCSFDADVSLGDEIYGAAYLEMNNDGYSGSDGAIINIYMDDPSRCFVKHTSKDDTFMSLLFSDGGIRILTNKLSVRIGGVLNEALGEEKGALALGFFTGDRDGMPDDITRDFRRSGLSHLMAVSGSHIAILLGGIEFLLKRLRVRKQIRCAIIVLLGAAFLFIAGFSASACRSVLMLYAVYLGFFLYEENDSVTSLFVSVLLIVIISPFSIVDLGMWMSFLATLGLLTAFPVIEEKIPYPKAKKGITRLLLLILREIALISLMTVVANMFLIPIIWLFFKEISIVSILSNILITPLSSLFLMLIPFLIITFKIPVIGFLLKHAVSVLADGILFVVRIFSKAPNATVSLKYGFCTVIIILFTVSMLILLTVKIKRKLLIFIPFACAVVLYIVCFTVSSLFFSKPELTYISTRDGDEFFVIEEGSEISFCDNSDGSLYSCSNVLSALKNSNATEIRCYMLTHYHKGHVDIVDILSKEAVIRSIAMPVPSDNSSLEYSKAIWNIAKENDIEVIFYENSSGIELTDSVICNTVGSKDHEKGRFIAFSSEEKSFVYTSPYFIDSTVDYGDVIFGDHGMSDSGALKTVEVNADRIYLSSTARNRMTLVTDASVSIISRSTYMSKTVFILD